MWQCLKQVKPITIYSFIDTIHILQRARMESLDVTVLRHVTVRTVRDVTR